MEIDWEGLTKEVMKMCEEVGLPNACVVENSQHWLECMAIWLTRSLGKEQIQIM